MSLVNERRRAARPTTGRCHSKEVLLLHRAVQLGCKNQYGWGARACDHGYELGLQIEQQCDQQPEHLWLPEGLLEQEEAEFEHLLMGSPPGLEAPPGLEMCGASSHPSIGKDNLFFMDDTPMAMATDAMLASCGRENISCESFFAGPVNQVAPPANTQMTPKSSLHICLMDCIDDTSTVASENSPALFPRDLIDGGSTHTSPMNWVASGKKESERAVPSLEEALNFAPSTHKSVPSLAEALSFAPATPSLAEALAFAPTGTPKVTPKASTQISLEALAFAPPGTPKMTPKASTQISLEAMLSLSPAAKAPVTSKEGAAKDHSWNPSQAPFGMVPMGGVCPWWFSPSFPEVRSAGGVPGYPDASTYWPAAAAWNHSMPTNNIPQIATGISRASSATTNSSEVFKI